MDTNTKKHLTKKDIIRIVSRRSTRSLSAEEEILVEQALLQARGRDEHMSLERIDEALHALERSGQIDKFDRKGVLEACRKEFEKLEEQEVSE